MNDENEDYPGIPIELIYEALEKGGHLAIVSYIDSRHDINSPWNGFYSCFAKYPDANIIQYSYYVKNNSLTISPDQILKH